MTKMGYCLLLTVLAGVLIYASVDLPGWGAQDAPIYRETSAAGTPGAGYYYIHHAKEDADTPNMVTAVLADYRGFDTLGETLVVFTAGLACYFLLRSEV